MRTKLLAAALLGATVLAGPVACNMAANQAGVATPGTALGIDVKAMDKTVKPGDDFYAYANGAWMKTAVIPDDRNSVGSHTRAFDETEKRQTELVAGILKSDPAADSVEGKIKSYYNAYMDTAAIEAAGLTPLKADFDRYAAIADKTALAKVLGEQVEADLDLFNNNNDMSTENLFGLFITKALASDEVVPYVYQGGLGLPDREYYTSTDPEMVKAQGQYRTYIADLLTAAGLPDAQAKAARIYALEAKIAAAHASKEEVADFTKGGTLWTRADFAAKAPGLDWNTFFTAARLPNQQTFDAYSPKSITGIAALVGSEPLDAWKDWLAFHRLNAQTDVLPAKFDQLHFKFYGTTLAGTVQQRTRDKRALAALNTDIGYALGKAYTDKYFPAEAKAEVQGMVKNIKAAFSSRVKAIDWMAPETKKEALGKVEGMVVSVGYPDTWPDYSALTVSPTSAYANRMAAIRTYTDQQMAKLGKPQDRGEWWMVPQLVNAVNLPVQNALNFPAAILQPPFFDPSADLAFNYGSIGAVIGHEISHSFDSSGAAVDATGKLRNWWTPADLKHFGEQSQALVDQYNAYAAFPDLHLNGKLELGENGADVAGLAAAYDAYRAALGGKEAPVIDGFTGDQRFFIAYAQSWATKAREGALRQQIIGNPHAPGEFRAQTVRNVDAWYKAFDIKPGDKLYLAPEKRVHLW